MQIVHHFSCHHQTKEAKRPQKKGLVNLTHYEVINKNSGGGVELFELTWHNVYGGKTVIQNFYHESEPPPHLFILGALYMCTETQGLGGCTQVYPLAGSFLWGVGWWEGARAFFHFQF